MENKATTMIVKNVKIYKTIFVETYTGKEWLQSLKECHSDRRKDKKDLKMMINEHQKKGCDKFVDFEGNLLKLKLYPPLRNAMKGVYLAKVGNILDYKAKANALLKPRSNRFSTTLILQLVQKFEHKHKKEKTPTLEIHNEVLKDFIAVHNKHFTKHGGQVIKQVSKLERIFECTISLECIIQEKSQHIGIGSHFFYLNLQHCNVSLSFNKI
jgi:hypothetical protein